MTGRVAIRWGFACCAAIWSCAAPRTPDDALDGCGAMCTAFRRLGCAAGLPSPKAGVTCEERCGTQLGTGAVTPPIDCVARAKTADDVRACGERCTVVR